MAINKSKLILKENKSDNIARFFLSYSKDRSAEENRGNSYQILSLFKKRQAILLEINSSLCILPTAKERETFALDSLKELREMAIDYRYQKSESSSGGKSLVDLFSFGKTNTVHKILAFIPDQIWNQDAFQSILPLYGLRYYICKAQADGLKLLEDLYCGRITAEEMNDIFSFTIFDCSDFGQMGINTNLDKTAIQEILGLEN